MSTTTFSLRSALQGLPENASEAVVDHNFSMPLLEALGFSSEEIYPEYSVGNGKCVDKAARHNSGGDKFLDSQANPYLLLELKGQDSNLSKDAAQYQSAVAQLKTYLLAPKCKTAQWGILTNSKHIQLFHKHGKVIYPATQCIQIDLDKIDNVIDLIREKIKAPPKALTIVVYNNKGGVGKTTTAVNLAAILTFLKKRVLAIDFDPNQQDLTNLLGLPISEDDLYKALTDKDIELQSILHPFRFPLRNRSELRFDVITSDRKLAEATDNVLGQMGTQNMLYRKLESARQEYDYIVIDAPPNWRFFSKLAIYAADVVLIPTKHNNLCSLENAATAIKKFIPEIQAKKADGSPIPLPIFFNGEKITEPQLAIAQNAINHIIKTSGKEGFNLRPYFYPKWTCAKRDLHIPQIPSYANIAGSAFSRIPAVYRDRTAHDYYKNLAMEYFLQ